jgi:hypothetical protein
VYAFKNSRCKGGGEATYEKRPGKPSLKSIVIYSGFTWIGVVDPVIQYFFRRKNRK